MESKGEDAVYYVEYAYLPENTSDVKMRFQFAVIDVYLGTRSNGMTPGNTIFPINGPLKNDGHVAWQRFTTQIFQDRSADGWAKNTVERLTKERTLSLTIEEEGAELAGGERARFIRPYLVNAKRGTWLGFVMTYGVDDDERWTTDYYDLKYESKQPVTAAIALSNAR